VSLNNEEFGDLTVGVLVEVYSSSGGPTVIGPVQKLRKYGGKKAIAIVVNGRHFDRASCQVYLRPPEGLTETELADWRLNQEHRVRQFKENSSNIRETLHVRGRTRILQASTPHKKVQEDTEWGFILTTHHDSSVHVAGSEEAARRMVEHHEATDGYRASLTKRTIRTVIQTGIWEEAE